MDGGRRFKTSDADIRTKVTVIAANAGRYPVSAQCGILSVPRATYYWVLGHPEGERPRDPITDDVVRAHEEGFREYGAPKIKMMLEKRGIVASRRRISRIMMENGPVSAYSRKKHRPSGSKSNEAPLPNLLDRRFDGHAPRTHAVGDLTYVRTGRKWSYVCLLVNPPRNREIVGHSVGDRRDPGLVKAAFATVGFPCPTSRSSTRHPWKQVRQRLDRRDARGLRHREVPVGEGLPVRQRRDRVCRQQPEEGARPPRVVSRHRASVAEGQRVGVVLQQHEDPLDLGLHEPGRVQGSRAVPLRLV